MFGPKLRTNGFNPLCNSCAPAGASTHYSIKKKQKKYIVSTFVTNSVQFILCFFRFQKLNFYDKKKGIYFKKINMTLVS